MSADHRGADKNWFYSGKDGVPVGPYSFDELEALAQTSVISNATLVVQTGGTWTPWGEVLAGRPSSPSTQDTPQQDRRQSWMRIVVFGLLLFAPPNGLILIWCLDAFSERVRNFSTVAGVLWFYLMVLSSAEGNGASAFVRVTLFLAVMAGAVVAWKKWRHRIVPKTSAEKLPEARGQGSVVIAALLTCFCAPIAIAYALFSKRLTRSERIAVCLGRVHTILAKEREEVREGGGGDQRGAV